MSDVTDPRAWAAKAEEDLLGRRCETPAVGGEEDL